MRKYSRSHCAYRAILDREAECPTPDCDVVIETPAFVGARTLVGEIDTMKFHSLRWLIVSNTGADAVTEQWLKYGMLHNVYDHD